MSKISVIIPVYNTGEYLYKCISSISQQTHRDLEIIIVDDGSDLETADLCNHLALQDNRIRVFHKKNEGVSIARNIGILKSTGDFIGFVDSDDWISENMYERLLYTLEKYNSDIAICDATTIYNNNKTEPDTFSTIEQSTPLNKCDITPKILFEIAGSVCRGLYRRSIIVSNSVQFPSGLKFSEDRIFNLKAIGCSNKIFYLKESYYSRYVRIGSAVNSYYHDMTSILTRIDKESIKVLSTHWGDSYLREYWQHARGLYYLCITNTFDFRSAQTLKEKYRQIKVITLYKPLINTIIQHNNSDIRAKLLKNQRVLLLCLLSIVINLRNAILK